ncbi:Anther-specific protein LAT52 [Capsicum chinense]|nr:Anther-specific protein LAT52 [Capsicum chinense]
MAKAIMLLSALCIVALANFANCHHPETFDVEGMVYCDTCRVRFVTNKSELIEGATVKLQCRSISTGVETFTTEGTTDKDGKYKLTVEGDHQNDICEVTVVKSPREDCKEIVSALEKARIECSDNVGMHTEVRYANPLFFMKTQAVEGCPETLEELGLSPLEY